MARTPLDLPLFPVQVTDKLTDPPSDEGTLCVRGEFDGPAWDFYRFARKLGAMLGR